MIHKTHYEILKTIISGQCILVFFQHLIGKSNVATDDGLYDTITRTWKTKPKKRKNSIISTNISQTATFVSKNLSKFN